MGVVYGAACLWQWKVSADEVGWPDWTNQDKSWREAMEMRGSYYVGYVAKAMEGLNISDIEKRPDLSDQNQPLLAIEGTLYISYLNEGGQIKIREVPPDLPFKWFNPKTGTFGHAEKSNTGVFDAPSAQPWVLIIG